MNSQNRISAGNAGKQLAKTEKDIEALEAKRAKPVDMHLDEIIDKGQHTKQNTSRYQSR